MRVQKADKMGTASLLPETNDGSLISRKGGILSDINTQSMQAYLIKQPV